MGEDPKKWRITLRYSIEVEAEDEEQAWKEAEPKIISDLYKEPGALHDLFDINREQID